MPPVDAPIPLLILQNLSTALALPDGGDDYYHTVQEVVIADIDAGPEVVHAVPGIVLAVQGTDEEDAPGGDGPAFSESTRLNFNAWGVVEDTDPQTALVQLVHDIHFAIMVDIRRGLHPTTSQALAIDTIWRGFDIQLPVPNEEPRAWCECRFLVHYRTSDTDMAVGI